MEIVPYKQSLTHSCLVDPWHGKEKKISSETLEKGIDLLKTHVKMCPLVFSMS